MRASATAQEAEADAPLAEAAAACDVWRRKRGGGSGAACVPRLHAEVWKSVNGGPLQRWADPRFDFGAWLLGGGGGFGGLVFGHAGLDVVEKGAKMRAGVSTQGRWRLVCVALVGLVRARVGYIRVGHIRVDHFGFAFDDPGGGLAR